MTFAERLKELRTEHGMSMDDVARRIGVGRANVYKYEHGMITNIPPIKVHRLANLFGVSKQYLMGWTDERKENPAEDLDMVAEKRRRHPGNRAEDDLNNGEIVLSGPDCATAANQASRALVKFGIARTPVYPQQIIQASHLCSMISFERFEEMERISAAKRLHDFRNEHGLVTSSVCDLRGGVQYLFAYNRAAPIGPLRYALAIELGHVYLGHVYLGHMGFHEKTVKTKEAVCFAIHLMFPRPVIRLLEERGFVFTHEAFARIFGDCDGCIEHILRAQPMETSVELNRLLKEQFAPYADMLTEIGVLEMECGDEEDVLNLDRYMAGYED